MRRLNNRWLFFILLMAFAGFANAQDHKVIKEATFPANSGEKLTVQVAGGDISVSSWGKSEVEVVIKGNDKAARKMSFEIEKTSDGVKVESERNGDSFWNFFNSLSYTVYIKVPEKYDLKLKTSGGDVNIRKVEGESYISTSGGDIAYAGGKGESKMSTSGGDIDVKEFHGPVSLSTSGGDIKYSGEDSDVNASTSGGDIIITTTNGKVKGETSGGDIRLRFSGENKGIYLGTSGGDVIADLGEDVSGYVDATSSGGDIESHNSNFRADKISSHSMKGSLKDGGETIRLKTSGGDVVIR